MSPFVWMTVAATVALLVAEFRGFRSGVWAAKPTASLGFILVALSAGALDSAYGAWVLAALMLSLVGDVLLIPSNSKRTFRAGLGSFLLAHLCFALAFAVRGLDVATTLASVALLTPVLFVVLRWLVPHLSPNLRIPVGVYTVVISVMVACGAGAAVRSHAPAVLVGALLFYVSDLAVARNQFVTPSFANKLWGLPLYYAGQLVLASTVS